MSNRFAPLYRQLQRRLTNVEKTSSIDHYLIKGKETNAQLQDSFFLLLFDFAEKNS
jgi:hypothetical protein